MIEVENLSKRYGKKLAVDGLDFTVQPGIVTGFLGSNGAGKSTTMRMIAGLDEPTTGRVLVKRFSVSPHSFHGAKCHRDHSVPQFTDLMIPAGNSSG